MVPDSPLYEKILYISKERLDSVTKTLKSGKEVTAEAIEQLMVPEDLSDKSVLVPIDVSVEAFGEFYEGHEELLEELGPKAFAEAVVEAAKLFEKTKANFKDDERPIPMTIGEWKAEPDDDDDAEEEEEDEEEAEEEGEDGDEEEDAEAEEPAAKKAKKA